MLARLLLSLILATSAFAATITPIETPAKPGSSAPYLHAASDGSLLATWLEPNAKGQQELKVARLVQGRWSVLATLGRGAELFANWADFPSIVEAQDGTLHVHWLQKNGKGTYAYDVMMARSNDGGFVWSKPMRLNDDGIESEHGFVSLVADPARPVVHAVWLDGRKMGAGEGHHAHGEMTLRYATIDAKGAVAAQRELDARTCECCGTGMAWTDAGPVVLFRDRDANEMRDIGVLRLTKSGWAKPGVLHADGWKIAGCPVNGPQIAAKGSTAVAAWFTAPAEKGRVNVAWSSDSGATFAKPVKIDAGAPLGRVEVILLPDGDALAFWIEGTAEKAAIVARRVAKSGKTGPLLTIARTSAARAAGFPRAALDRTGVVVAWTETTPEKRVRMARVTP